MQIILNNWQDFNFVMRNIQRKIWDLKSSKNKPDIEHEILLQVENFNKNILQLFKKRINSIGRINLLIILNTYTHFLT